MQRPAAEVSPEILGGRVLRDHPKRHTHDYDRDCTGLLGRSIDRQACAKRLAAERARLGQIRLSEQRSERHAFVALAA